MVKRWLLLGLMASLGSWAGAVEQKVAAVKHKPVQAKPAAAKAKPKVVPPAPAPAAVEAEPDEHQLLVAQQVHVGRMVCELGNQVQVSADPNNPARFVLSLKQHTFRMVPVVSSTGAIRLEDAQAGAMWLQLANKSMLMSSKLGQRLADECQSPAQMAVAEHLKNNPVPSLLDDPSVARK